MPQVAPFFAGLTGIGTAGASIGAFTAGLQVANFFTTIAGRLLLTVAVSALQMALVDHPTSQVAGLRTSQTLTGGTNPASFILGRYATDGQLVAPPMSHGTSGGTPNAYLTYVIELADLPHHVVDELILDGERAPIGTTQHADYGLPIQGRFEGHAWIKTYDGTQTAADPMLVDRYGDYERPWGADRIGSGISYAILTFLFNREIFNSFPRVRFVVWGLPLYDPRKDGTIGGEGTHRWDDPSTWERSENAAVQKYNVLRGIHLPNGEVWGGKASPSALPLDVWWSAMNTCDIEIPLDDGGTEPQYRSSYEVRVTDEPAQVLEELGKASSTTFAETGGQYKLRVGGPGLPVWFISDKDLIITELQELRPFPRANDTFNGVHARHPDPDSIWQDTDAPPRYNLPWEAADGGQRRVAELRLPTAPYPNQVQRVAASYIGDHRRFRRHTHSLPPDAGVLEPLDVIGWSSIANGYANKSFEVTATQNPLVTGNPLVSMRETDPSDFTPAVLIDTPPSSSPGVVRPVLPLLGFDVADHTLFDASGNVRRSQIRVSWAITQTGLPGMQWEMRLKQSGDVVARGQSLDIASGETFIDTALIPAQTYQVRARPISNNPTTWTHWTDVTVSDVRPGLPDISAELGQMITRTVRTQRESEVETLDLIDLGIADLWDGFRARSDLVTAEAKITRLEATRVDSEGAIAAVSTEVSAQFGSLAALAQAAQFAEVTADGITEGFVWRLGAGDRMELVRVSDGTGGDAVKFLLDADVIEITGDMIVNGRLLVSYDAQSGDGKIPNQVVSANGDFGIITLDGQTSATTVKHWIFIQDNNGAAASFDWLVLVEGSGYQSPVFALATGSVTIPNGVIGFTVEETGVGFSGRELAPDDRVFLRISNLTGSFVLDGQLIAEQTLKV